MARPSVRLNVTFLKSLLVESGPYVGFVNEKLIRDAIDAAHPAHVQTRKPTVNDIHKLVLAIPESMTASLSCQDLWDLYPEKGYTGIHQLFRYLKNVNAAFDYYYH